MDLKNSIRSAARQARRDQPDKDSVSERIIDHLESLPQYRKASNVMWYVNVRDEVRTLPPVLAAIEADGQALIPVCVGEELAVFRLTSPHELSPGAFGILEPSANLIAQQERLIDPRKPDLIVVPGVAFDTNGGRIGYGRGFYDRFFLSIDPAAVLVGLAYECQVWDRVPTEDHDVAIDWLITEERIIDCRSSLGVRASREDC